MEIQNSAAGCGETGRELCWMLVTSGRVQNVLRTLLEGGYLVQSEERSFPNKPRSKTMKTVTRLFDKNGKRLDGVHNYARMRLIKIGSLEAESHGKTTVFRLNPNKTPPRLA
jgi:hypothetical protein